MGVGGKDRGDSRGTGIGDHQILWEALVLRFIEYSLELELGASCCYVEPWFAQALLD